MVTGDRVCPPPARTRRPWVAANAVMGLAGVFLAGSYRAASRRADNPEGSKSGSLSFTISPMTGGCPAPAGMVEPWGKSVSSTSSRSAV